MDDDDDDDSYVHSRNQSSLASLGHTLVRLSPDNISRLLSTASAVPEKRRAEADAICARLADLNPQVARHFQPKQTVISRLKLRMIQPVRTPLTTPVDEIQIQITHNNNNNHNHNTGRDGPEETVQIPLPRDEIDSFVVVSYCWHYPSWRLPRAASPVADGWKISRPMVDEVMRLAAATCCPQGSHSSSSSGGGAVWLDQLCIDQTDEDDKTTHVGGMDLIYRSARRVLILLEDVQLESDEEMLAALVYKGFYQDMCDYVKDHDLEGAEKGLFVKECFPRWEREWCERYSSAAASSGADAEAAAAAAAAKFDVRRLRYLGKRFIVRMLSARWFSRAWCAHESRVTTHGKINNPLFLCFAPESTTTTATTTTSPNDSNSTSKILTFEFRFVHYFALYLCDLTPPNPAHTPSLDDLLNQQALMDDPDPTELWQLWYRIQRLLPENSPESSAMQHLVSILSFGCTFKGDLMSIALNTSSIPLVFTGRAESVEDVIWMFALLVLAAGDVVPLISDGGKLRVPCHSSAITSSDNDEAPAGDSDGGGDQAGDTRAGQTIISWAPRTTQAVLDHTIALTNPGYITSVTRDYIELDLLVCESLPAMASPSAQEKAESLITRFGLDAAASTLAASADAQTQKNSQIMAAVIDRIKEGRPGPLHVLVKLWLAHGIDCGVPWMCRFPGVMERDTQEWTHGVLGDIEDETLLPAAEELLSLVSEPTTSATTTTTTTTTTITTTTPGKPGADLRAAQEAPGPSPSSSSNSTADTETPRRLALFLRTILDPRLKFLTASPRRLPVSPDDSAMTFCSSNRAYIAVPLALAHLPSWQKRAWVLEPYDPATDPASETLADFLPDPVRTKIEPGEKLEDVYPVLSSDYEDRRRPRGEGHGGWRLRKREVIFGWEGWDDEVLKRLMDGNAGPEDGDGYVVYLKRQRVYGAEDYNWGAIFEVARRIEGTGGGAEAADVVS